MAPDLAELPRRVRGAPTQDVPDQCVARAARRPVEGLPRRRTFGLGPRRVHPTRSGSTTSSRRWRASKRSFAALSGCDADEVAITTNVSIALSTVASCLDLTGPRNRVAPLGAGLPDGRSRLVGVGRPDRRRGRLAPVSGRPDAPVEVFDEAIDERTALVMVNRVLYRSSAVVDAKAVCALARSRGALSFVDDYHGIGVLPLDLHDLGCDLYAAGTLKWLCGGPGCVFLYARRELLPQRSSPASPGGSRRPTPSRSTPSTSGTTRPPAASSTARRRRRCSSSPRAGST